MGICNVDRDPSVIPGTSLHDWLTNKSKSCRGSIRDNYDDSYVSWSLGNLLPGRPALKIDLSWQSTWITCLPSPCQGLGSRTWLTLFWSLAITPVPLKSIHSAIQTVEALICTNNQSSLLSTLHSRCQQVKENSSLRKGKTETSDSPSSRAKPLNIRYETK